MRLWWDLAMCWCYVCVVLEQLGKMFDIGEQNLFLNNFLSVIVWFIFKKSVWKRWGHQDDNIETILIKCCWNINVVLKSYSCNIAEMLKWHWLNIDWGHRRDIYSISTQPWWNFCWISIQQGYGFVLNRHNIDKMFTLTYGPNVAWTIETSIKKCWCNIDTILLHCYEGTTGQMFFWNTTLIRLQPQQQYPLPYGISATTSLIQSL